MDVAFVGDLSVVFSANVCVVIVTGVVSVVTVFVDAVVIVISAVEEDTYVVVGSGTGSSTVEERWINCQCLLKFLASLRCMYLYCVNVEISLMTYLYVHVSHIF